MKIKTIHGREILDSRGIPTIEVDVELTTGHKGRMMVPSGASTGMHEALELRDQDISRYEGKGVTKAVQHVNTIIFEALYGLNALDQEYIDKRMIEIDGTNTKSRLGANAILGVSMAIAHAAATSMDKHLYQYIGERSFTAGRPFSIPMPMVNMISGGLHAGKNIEFQDYLIIPCGARNYPEALEIVSKVHHRLKSILAHKNYIHALVADEGGFGPKFSTNRLPLDLLVEAIEQAKFQPGKDVVIALDVAASHFYDKDTGRYKLASEGKVLSAAEMIDYLETIVNLYPIVSIEDGLHEDDWSGWVLLTKRLGNRIQIVGDDLFTTNTERIRRGINEKTGNSVLVKMNQIGTLTETIEAVHTAKNGGFGTIISARSGETEDHTLADLAVGLNGDQIKIGSLTRSSRLSKYNQLLRINEHLLNPIFLRK